MSEENIKIGGEERTVREDTAKSYRGTMWALTVVGLFVVVAAILFFVFFLRSAGGDKPLETPAQIENKR